MALASHHVADQGRPGAVEHHALADRASDLAGIGGVSVAARRVAADGLAVLRDPEALLHGALGLHLGHRIARSGLGGARAKPRLGNPTRVRGPRSVAGDAAGASWRPSKPGSELFGSGDWPRARRQARRGEATIPALGHAVGPAAPCHPARI